MIPPSQLVEIGKNFIPRLFLYIGQGERGKVLGGFTLLSGGRCFVVQQKDVIELGTVFLGEDIVLFGLHHSQNDLHFIVNHSGYEKPAKKFSSKLHYHIHIFFCCLLTTCFKKILVRFHPLNIFLSRQ